MKNDTFGMPDEETLRKYWGSADAYLEEQRRTATYNMEANQVANDLDYSNTSLLGANFITAKRKAISNGLHLPFSSRHVRHA